MTHPPDLPPGAAHEATLRALAEKSTVTAPSLREAATAGADALRRLAIGDAEIARLTTERNEAIDLLAVILDEGLPWDNMDTCRYCCNQRRRPHKGDCEWLQAQTLIALSEGGRR